MMQPNTKHAITNPNQWINLLSIFALVIPTISEQEWVKSNPWYLFAVGLVNFAITSGLQALRDYNKPPATPIQQAETNIKEAQNTIFEEVKKQENK